MIFPAPAITFSVFAPSRDASNYFSIFAPSRDASNSVSVFAPSCNARNSFSIVAPLRNTSGSFSVVTPLRNTKQFLLRHAHCAASSIIFIFVPRTQRHALCSLCPSHEIPSSLLIMPIAQDTQLFACRAHHTRYQALCLPYPSHATPSSKIIPSLCLSLRDKTQAPSHCNISAQYFSQCINGICLVAVLFGTQGRVHRSSASSSSLRRLVLSFIVPPHTHLHCAFVQSSSSCRRALSFIVTRFQLHRIVVHSASFSHCQAHFKLHFCNYRAIQCSLSLHCHALFIEPLRHRVLQSSLLHGRFVQHRAAIRRFYRASSFATF